MLARQLIILFYVLISASVLHAQSKASLTDSLTSALSKKYLDKIDNKISAINRGIEKKSFKMLLHFKKQENKIQKKLAVKDSIAAQ